jgi:hypothetical protein
VKLYKFRSFHDLDYLLDILVMRRLYCAPPSTLNDPFEGVYLSYLALRERSMFIAKKRPRSVWEPGGPGEQHRLCSLSATMTDIRLWANYADGNRGVAIEIDIPDTEPTLHKVQYVDALSEHAVHVLDPVPSAVKILATKTRHWGHEEEYRIVQADTYFPLGDSPISVFMGTRIDYDGHKERIAILKRFEGRGVTIVPTLLDAESLEVKSAAWNDRTPSDTEGAD